MSKPLDTEKKSTGLGTLGFFLGLTAIALFANFLLLAQTWQPSNKEMLDKG